MKNILETEKKKKYDLPASSHNRHSFPPAAEEKDSIKYIF